MKKYGYCRISTPQQNIERQIRNIQKEYPDILLIQEVYSGTSQDRPEWNKLYKVLKEGDTVIFDSVSRMSRNAEEGFKEYQDLYNKGINLIFIKEPHINTATYKKALAAKVNMTGDKVDYILEGVNKYLMALAEEQIKLAFEQSQKEVDDLRLRTKEGIETARRNGKQIGQRKGNSLNIKKEEPIKSIIRNKSKDFFGTLSDVELMAMLSGMKVKITVSGKEKEISSKISRNTFYKYKNELKQMYM